MIHINQNAFWHQNLILKDEVAPKLNASAEGHRISVRLQNIFTVATGARTIAINDFNQAVHEWKAFLKNDMILFEKIEKIQQNFATLQLVEKIKNRDRNQIFANEDQLYFTKLASNADQKTIVDLETKSNLILLCVRSENAFIRSLAAICLKPGNADPNSQDAQGMTPLHFSIAHDEDKLTAKLIKEKANLGSHVKDQPTPLDLALKKERYDLILDLHDKIGLEWDLQLGEGKVLWKELLKDLSQEKPKKMLVSMKLKLNIKAPVKSSILNWIKSENVALNTKDEQDKTIFQVVCEHHDVDLARTLILCGAIPSGTAVENEIIRKGCSLSFFCTAQETFEFLKKLSDLKALPSNTPQPVIHILTNENSPSCWRITAQRETHARKALSFVWERKDYSLLPFYMTETISFTKVMGIDKKIMNFLLDKAWLEGQLPIGLDKKIKYESGESGPLALFLATALSKVLLELEQNEIHPLGQEEMSLRSFIPKLIKSFSLYSRWAYSLSCNEKNIVAKEIVEVLKDPNRDFPVLIPVILKNHGICLYVDFTSSSEGTAMMHNTGGGLRKHHFKLFGKYRYQTFLSKEKIPMDALLQESTWETFLEGTGSINQAYRRFYALGNGGTIAPPSKDSFDYEQVQMRGTCAGQCLMSAFKKLVKDAISGSREAKTGAYQVLKARTMKQFVEDNSCEPDFEIKNAVREKLKKHKAALELVSIANDKKAFEGYHQALLSTVAKWKKDLKNIPVNTSFERFFFLRSSALAIASKRLENPKLFQKLLTNNALELVLNLAKVVLEEKQFIQKQISLLLDHRLKNNEWDNLVEDCLTVVFYSPYGNMITNWLDRQFKKRGKSFRDPFNKVLEKSPSALASLSKEKKMTSCLF